VSWLRCFLAAGASALATMAAFLTAAMAALGKATVQVVTLVNWSIQ